MDGQDTRERMAARLRLLLLALESGDDAGFDNGLDALAREREQGLFAHVARLTRSLHEQVSDMRFDEHLARLAGDEMPDARHRLDYIMQMTEKAAHHTLDLVDQARAIGVRYQRIAETVEAPAARAELAEATQDLRTTLSELSQAQEYQDIAGQLIKRVITLVRNVETALLELLQAAGGLQSAPRAPITPSVSVLPGPAVAGRGPAAASQQDADALLANLGF
jgi:chemotaxis protein CheZ